MWNPDLLEEGYDLVAFGRAEQTPISQAAIQARLDAAPRVKKSLEEVVLKSAADILGTYAGPRPRSRAVARRCGDQS